MPVLIFAIVTKSIQCLRLLLQHGADPEQTWQKLPAKLWVEISNGSPSDEAQMLRLLSKR